MILGIVDPLGGELACVVRKFTIILLQAFFAQIWIDFTILEQLLKKYHAPDDDGHNVFGKL